jgi:hypothetical protein
MDPSRGWKEMSMGYVSDWGSNPDLQELMERVLKSPRHSLIFPAVQGRRSL